VEDISVSDKVAATELGQETVYFAQIRFNNQITVPKEAMDDKELHVGDVIAIAVMKIVDGKTSWSLMSQRLKK
jgi:hypothetical protein